MAVRGSLVVAGLGVALGGIVVAVAMTIPENFEARAIVAVRQGVVGNGDLVRAIGLQPEAARITVAGAALMPGPATQALLDQAVAEQADTSRTRVAHSVALAETTDAYPALQAAYEASRVRAITVSARSSTAVAAAALANAYASEYVAYRASSVTSALKQSATELRLRLRLRLGGRRGGSRAAIHSQLSEIATLIALAPSQVIVYEKAPRPADPAAPHPWRDGLVAGALLLFGALTVRRLTSLDLRRAASPST